MRRVRGGLDRRATHLEGLEAEVRKVAVATETSIPAILGTCGGKGGTQGPP